MCRRTSTTGHVICDVAVVGAGPAGTAAALALRRRRPDLDVLIVDRAPPGRDKACGDAIGPDGPSWLAAVGQPHLLAETEQVRRFRVVAPAGTSMAGSPPAPGFVVPRAAFDARLLGAARAAGAGFLPGRLTRLRQDDTGITLGLQDGEVVRARHAVGADGANSVVRRLLGIPANTGRHMAVAVRGYVRRPVGFDELLLVFDGEVRPMGYAWAFPTADGRVNIGYGAATDAAPAGRGRLVARCRELLAAAAPELGPDDDFTGHRLPLSSRRPAPAHGRVLLAGDAASSVNPLSGEGICYALASGVLAGEAIASAPERAGPRAVGAGYVTALRDRFGAHHRQVAVAYRLMGPFVVNASVAVAARDPRLFAKLLGLALGAGTLSSGDVARFGLRWATGW